MTSLKLMLKCIEEDNLECLVDIMSDDKTPLTDSMCTELMIRAVSGNKREYIKSNTRRNAYCAQCGSGFRSGICAGDK